MAQDAKKGFLLYYDYRKHLALLNDEERGKLLMALLDYGEHGTQPELEGAALMAFSFIQAQMDRDAEKYAETVKKRSEAGKMGGSLLVTVSRRYTKTPLRFLSEAVFCVRLTAH